MEYKRKKGKEETRIEEKLRKEKKMIEGYEMARKLMEGRGERRGEERKEGEK